jgi:hypothetical protein
VTSIGNGAFAHCSELADVFCYAEKNPVTSLNAFEYSNIRNATLHVPATSFDAYNVEPWKSFGSIVGLDGKKCAMPTISYQNGELTFECETEGAVCLSTITDSDIKSYSDNKVKLSVTYTITVYATKTGYDNSNVVTATLCWIDKEPVIDVTGVSQVPAQAVLIQTDGGLLTVHGLDDGTAVSVYGVNGTEAGKAISRNGCATVNTNLQAGNVAIVKIGEKSVKVIVK